ncbi:MAG TPA: diguanylate cyclase [Dehalococcoidia bacterium]|nr:diguanylate cyclase [Dehalococcoidia bacterium]
MKPVATLTESAREEVRRVVLISRLAGLGVAAALAVAALYINRNTPDSAAAVAGYITVGVGLATYLALSTLARVGHARVLERALLEVRTLTVQLHDLAERDPLTGLYNLRACHRVLRDELEDARAANRTLTLIVADLDNFKVLNDAFGHQYGDEVLRATASVFAARAASGGLAARLGGDEFALVLPGADRHAALAVAGEIEASLRALLVDGQTTDVFGSFGIGTFPGDGDSVQALFAAADGRMYSEKHRRKAESLSSLAGAARKLFLRIGSAMRPDRTITQILQDVAFATRQEFVLSVCAISVQPRAHHPRVTAVSTVAPEVGAACVEAAARDQLAAANISAILPGEAWIIETPLPDELGDGGVLLLAGLPMRSFRPDASVVVALTDLLHAGIANARAHVDALRVGKERDIHIDLAHALAGGGALDQRLAAVTRLINDFIGASSASIEGLHPVASGIPYELSANASGAFVDAWHAARDSADAREFVRQIAEQAPVVIVNPAADPRVPAAQRSLLQRARVAAIAAAPIRFDGVALGILGAASDSPTFFDDDKMALLLNIADHLAPAINVALLRDELEASYAQLERESRDSLARLADAAEARDPHTGGHLRRIQRYSVELARQLGLPDAEAQAIGAASAVHDLGKLSLPDAVLMKPGKLTPDDWDRMREHPRHGEQLIGDSPKFELERAVARWHHERWDGSGYPDGLVGDQIPLAARIVAVADAFDALTTERPYKRAWPVDEAMSEVHRASGTLFCPAVVAALDALWRSRRLAQIYHDALGAEHAFAEHRREAA